MNFDFSKIRNNEKRDISIISKDDITTLGNLFYDIAGLPKDETSRSGHTLVCRYYALVCRYYGSGVSIQNYDERDFKYFSKLEKFCGMMKDYYLTSLKVINHNGDPIYTDTRELNDLMHPDFIPIKRRLAKMLEYSRSPYEKKDKYYQSGGSFIRYGMLMDSLEDVPSIVYGTTIIFEYAGYVNMSEFPDCENAIIDYSSIIDFEGLFEPNENMITSIYQNVGRRTIGRIKTLNCHKEFDLYVVNPLSGFIPIKDSRLAEILYGVISKNISNDKLKNLYLIEGKDLESMRGIRSYPPRNGELIYGQSNLKISKIL